MSAAAWDAKAYHKVSNPQFEWGKKVLSRLELRGDETVVDVGCGTGRLTALLCDKLPRGRVIAVDRDAGMIEEAKRHLGDRAEYLVASALDLPAYDADAIFSTATFHWIPEHDRLFPRLFAALGPGGRLVAQCGGGRNLHRVLERLSVILAEPDVAPYFNGVGEPWYYATAEQTAARMTAAGFSDVATSLTPAPTPFATRDDFRTFCARVILGQRLHPLTDSTLRERVIDRVAELASHDDPPFVLDYERLDMFGRRP